MTQSCDARRRAGLSERDLRQPADAGPLRFAFADPPYPGQARRHYGNHQDYGGEVNHAELIARLMDEYDGWALCSGARMIRDIAPLCPDGVRVLVWCKPLTPYKPGVSVQFGWEPVYLWGGRRRGADRPMLRDFLLLSPEQWMFRGGAPAGAVIGMKPRAFCAWIFEALGARPTDDLVDLFPGSGAVTEAWRSWRAQSSLIADLGDQLEMSA
jgi:hypothetical protein